MTASDADAWVEGVTVIIEEKIDGANLGVSLAADWTPRFQNRSHYGKVGRGTYTSKSNPTPSPSFESTLTAFFPPTVNHRKMYYSQRGIGYPVEGARPLVAGELRDALHGPGAGAPYPLWGVDGG